MISTLPMDRLHDFVDWRTTSRDRAFWLDGSQNLAKVIMRAPMRAIEGAPGLLLTTVASDRGSVKV